MDVVEKSASATVAPIESDDPNGEFEVILSTETLDRDDENLWADEWKQPLPARIHIDGDHGRSIEKTVGSAVPSIDGDRMVGHGTYAGTPYAQMVRQLVNEGHINSLSVTYAEHKNQKGNGVQRELLNAAFVAIPANPEAIVLSSKSAKKEDDKPYGNVAYADPKNGKYPIDTVEHVRSAWSYINVPKNAAEYSADELSAVKGRIRSAATKFGIDIGDDSKKAAKVGTMDSFTLAELVAKAAGGKVEERPKHDDMVQGIHDAAAHLGAQCAPIDYQPATDPGLKAAGGLSASGDNPAMPKHDAMTQAIHDASWHLGAQCLNEIEADPGTADGANKSVQFVFDTYGSKEFTDWGEAAQWLKRAAYAHPETELKIVTKSSSTESVGTPPESAEESAAPAAAEKSAAADAADESADPTALAKAKQLEMGRGTAYLISKNSKD